MDTTTKTQTVEISAEFLREIATLATVASSDNTKPILTGIHVSVQGNVLTATATDSYYLARMKRTVIGDDLETLIPAAYLTQLSKAMGKKFTGTVQIEINGLDVSATYNDGSAQTIGSRVINGTYPNVDSLINDNETEIANETVRAANDHTVALDLNRLATLSKVYPWSAKAPTMATKIWVTSPNKAIKISAELDRRVTTVLLMPVRVQ
jgi:DNA polymerase III sliding clamp (beta) subunit (PCNA family)